MGLEYGDGFVGIRLGSPVATSKFEKSSSNKKVVPRADDVGIAKGSISGNGEFTGRIKLIKQSLNGCWWIPRLIEAFDIGIKVV